MQIPVGGFYVYVFLLTSNPPHYHIFDRLAINRSSASAHGYLSPGDYAKYICVLCRYVYVHVCVFFWYVYILNNISLSWNLPCPSYKHVALLADSFSASVGFHNTIFPNHRSIEDYWLPSPFNVRAFFDIFLCVPLTFLLTQYKAWVCFYKEALNDLSIPYYT